MLGCGEEKKVLSPVNPDRCRVSPLLFKWGLEEGKTLQVLLGGGRCVCALLCAEGCGV